MTEEQRGQAAYDAVSRLVNTSGGEAAEAFVSALLSDHRTLQQGAIALFANAIVKFHTTAGEDARNAAAHVLAEVVYDALREDDRTEFFAVRAGEGRLPVI